MTAVDTADIVDIPDLATAAAMAATDYFPTTQGTTTPKKQPGSAIATFVLAQNATTQAAHDSSLKLATTAFVQQERIGKNHVRNGDFQVWQRGTSFAGVAYGIDLWKQLTTASRTYSRQAGFSGARHCFRFGRDNGATGTTALPIGHVLTTEDAIALAGKQVIISCDIRAGANWSGTAVTARIITGTGIEETLNISAITFPTGSAASSNLAASAVPTTTETRITFDPYTMPSGITEAGFRINYTPVGTAGAADYLEITNVKFEEGPIATGWEPEAFDDVLQHCMSRVQKSFVYATTPAQNVGANTGGRKGIAGKAGATAQLIDIPFRVPMRAGCTPTVTLYNPEAANAQVRDQTASVDCSATGTENATENGFTVTCTGNASTAVGNKLAVHFLAVDDTF